MTTDQTVQAQIVELERRLEALKRQVDGVSASTVEGVVNRLPQRSMSRRRLFGAAGATAAGTALALARAEPAAASDPNDVVKDADNIVTGTTRLTGGRLEVKDTDVSPIVGFTGSLMGFGGKDEGGSFNGVIGSTRREDGYGVIAMGARSAGVRSQLLLEPEGPPPPTTNSHRAGEISVEQSGVLWYCIEGGSSPKFLTISGPNAAGAYYAIDPVSVYDSRLAAIPNSGKFSSNSNRLISIKDGRDNTGAVTLPDVVPERATAITCNLAISRTRGKNSFAVTPGDANEFTVPSITWRGKKQTLSNQISVKLDDNRQVRLFCGPRKGSTHVTLDVTGYYL